MGFQFSSSTARAAWASATSQTAQLEALRDEWTDQVSVRYYSSGNTHLATVTHGTPIVDTSTDPYSLKLGAWVAESHITDGTASYCIWAVPGGADILRADCSLAGPISDPGGRVRTDIGTVQRVNATASLPATSMPAWLSGMSVNEWKELTGTKLSDQPTMAGAASVAGKQDAWCGWHVDRRTNKLYSAGQGGHDDYWGSEVNAIDVSADAPAWSELVAPTASANVTSNSDYYTDGKPASLHGYHSAIFVPSMNRAVRFFGGSRSTIGNPIQTITAFNAGTGAWDAASVWSGSDAPGFVAGNTCACAIHPTTEAVYLWIYNGLLARWNKGTPGSFTTLISSPSNPAAQSTAADVDPTRGDEGQVFFLGGGDGGTMCRVYDIAANSLTTITLTGTDISASTGMGLFYCAATDRYYACIAASGGSSVYEITPNSGTSWACALLSATGGSAIPATNGNSAHHPFTKFLYLPLLGVAIFGPRWGYNLWALRLHAV